MAENEKGEPGQRRDDDLPSAISSGRYLVLRSMFNHTSLPSVFRKKALSASLAAISLPLTDIVAGRDHSNTRYGCPKSFLQAPTSSTRSLWDDQRI